MTGTLSDGEVFVKHGILDNFAAWNASTRSQEVLVARFPLVRPSALRRFTLAQTAALDDFFLNTCGVVVFSTRGRCRPVAVMGGDYDGDLYFVCWNSALLEHCCAPLGSCVQTDAVNLPATCIPAEVPNDSGTICVQTSAYDDDEEEEYDGDAHVAAVRPLVDVTNLADEFMSTLNICVARSTSKLASNSHHDEEDTAQLDDAQLSSALLWEAVSSSQTHARAVGVTATQWLISADRRGVDHPITLSWADWHEQSLKARKHGTVIALPSTVHVLSHRGVWVAREDLYPHFLAKTSVHSYVSTSLLGSLYDLAQARSCEQQKGVATAQVVVLDPSMRHSKAREYLQDLDSLLNQFLRDTQDAAAAHSQQKRKQLIHPRKVATMRCVGPTLQFRP
jgi:hypothetical protein